MLERSQKSVPFGSGTSKTESEGKITDKYEELKRDYTSLCEKTKDFLREENSEEELLFFTVAASLRIWAQNMLYSPDYSEAISTISGQKYSIEQIVTAMGCCGEDERPMRVPEFFAAMVKTDTIFSNRRINDWLRDYSSFLAAMALINGDFTIEEANALTEIIGVLARYAESQGARIESSVYSQPPTTAVNDTGYLRNNDLLTAAHKYKAEKASAVSVPNTADANASEKPETPTLPITITLEFKTDGNGSAEDTDTTQDIASEGPALKVNEPEERKNETLDSLLGELDELVGLENVKQDVHSLINFIRVSRIRQERGMKVPTISYHLVFTGNPGTGKTTVARLVARLYYQMGILPKGQLVETDRSALVAGYLGQTAIKTQKVIQEAMGGVLFIDEAYSLAGETDDSYGKEAIDTILKAMEDHRDELIVIVAGYTELMHKFIESNPGLSSRFSKYFEFKDYSESDLILIFKKFCESNGYALDEDAAEVLNAHFQKLYENRDSHFGNARTARNIFEKAINAQADRLASQQAFTDEDLAAITAEDIVSAIGGAV